VSCRAALLVPTRYLSRTSARTTRSAGGRNCLAARGRLVGCGLAGAGGRTGPAGGRTPGRDARATENARRAGRAPLRKYRKVNRPCGGSAWRALWWALDAAERLRLLYLVPLAPVDDGGPLAGPDHLASEDSDTGDPVRVEDVTHCDFLEALPVCGFHASRVQVPGDRADVFPVEITAIDLAYDLRLTLEADAPPRSASALSPSLWMRSLTAPGRLATRQTLTGVALAAAGPASGGAAKSCGPLPNAPGPPAYGAPSGLPWWGV
jgi:hypothetical protein